MFFLWKYSRPITRQATQNPVIKFKQTICQATSIDETLSLREK